VPVFLAMSLLPECYRWSERAILGLDTDTRGGLDEMRLQSGLAMALIFTRAHSDSARTAFERSLAIAEHLGDVRNQMLLLGPLSLFHFRTANFKKSLTYAQRSAAVAKQIGTSSAIGLAHCLLGVSLHYAGDLERAGIEIDAGLQYADGSDRMQTIYLGFDCYNWAAIPLARNLWLQGYPDQAVARALQAVDDAERIGHAVTLTIVLHWAASVFLWVGDLANAEMHVDRFIARAETHSLGPYLTVGRGLKAELAIRHGNAQGAVPVLEGCLEQLHAARYELLTTAFKIALIRGLAALGRIREGIALVDEAIKLTDTTGEASFLPELIRLKANLLLSYSPPDQGDAEAYLARSLGLSRRQGAKAWELRTATDLAALWASQRNPKKARDLLQPIYAQFQEGFDTADLRAAKNLLAELR
jgi:tetratricopeptide (TPR) repeat protein